MPIVQRLTDGTDVEGGDAVWYDRTPPEHLNIRSLADLAARQPDTPHGQIECKWLAAASLQLNGWPLSQIGRALGHSKGHVSRMIRVTLKRVAREFRADVDDAAIDAALESAQKKS